jgi:hypothetical protein
MKLSEKISFVLLIAATFAMKFDTDPTMGVPVRQRKQTRKPVDRNLVQNLTSSYLLGNTPDVMNTNMMQSLVNQSKAMKNIAQVNTWVSDLEQRLDDLRDTINRKLNDMTVGMQRRNIMIGHYNYMGEAVGVGNGTMGGMNPISAA